MGILKSGATFTVIDPAYPVDRQIIYLKIAQSRGVISLGAAGKVDPAVQEFIDSKLNVRCQLDGLEITAPGSVTPPPLSSSFLLFLLAHPPSHAFL